jgi:hypothetical protein
MGKPIHPIPEVTRRTLQNPYAIHDLREQRQQQGIGVDREGPFEVTQLVNSFLGALAHPWEALFKNRDPGDFPQLARLSRHLSNAQTIGGTAPNLIDQLGNIRNAFSQSYSRAVIHAVDVSCLSALCGRSVLYSIRHASMVCCASTDANLY